MFDIIGKKWWFFIFSAGVIIPGFISLFLWGLRPSIDFGGGTLFEFQIQNDKLQTSKEELINVIKSQATEVSSVQNSGQNTYLLRLRAIDQDQKLNLQKALAEKYGDVKEIRFETVGPTVGKETTVNAIKAVVVASVMIVLYIAFSFRQIPKPYSSLKFGVCALFALVHDVLLVVGVFSLFGHFLKVEIDSLFITALLTVMGFSVHDTIVVFDRIRENLGKMGNVSFAEIVNESIIQTLARSLSTSLTVLFTLLALLLFGGENIRWFIVALLIGIISGTYSSIFNAAPLLVLWEERK